jgi:DNA-binding transcriptional MerR regulator
MSERKHTRMKLDELAERAGVSPRTVRYYVQRGLLTAPEFRGPDTVYEAEHLARLRAIRALQARHLPLDAIQEALSGRTLDEVERIARGELPTDLVATAPVSRSHDDDERPAEVERVTRYALAPGLELHLTDSASPAVRALADALRKVAARR